MIAKSVRGVKTEVGCRLFERVGRKLVINQAGEHLLAGIEEPLASIDRTAASLHDIRNWGHGRLRIGVSATLAQYLLPRVLKELHAQFPRLDLLVETGDTPDLVNLLREQRIDLALGVVSDSASEMETRPIFEDELLLIISPKHRWADGLPMAKADIRACRAAASWTRSIAPTRSSRATRTGCGPATRRCSRTSASTSPKARKANTS